MRRMQKLPVYMDVPVYGGFYERMVFELFYDIAPFTAENFRALCTGEKGVSPRTKKKLCYANCFFHRVKKGSSYVKGGAFCYETGESVESIYGPYFPVESNNMKHDKEGLLSMSRRDQEASRSNFVITLKADQRLDSSHVDFGKLVEGLDTLRDIGDGCFGFAIEVEYCGVVFNVRDIPRDVVVRPCPSSRRASEDRAKRIGEGKMKKRKDPAEGIEQGKMKKRKH